MTPRVRSYVELAASVHGTTPAAIFSRSRKRVDAYARADVMQRLREDGFTLQQIARWLDRDHSTVIHMLRRTDK